ncbi:hypothetical protein HZA73_01325 [candidate division TA06 bacterium]|nr:hypothetical protein [candidate division TA06 bacterium]
MSQQELLKKAAGALEAAGIPYMLTGSTVSSMQGEPRATHDIDMVVVVSQKQLSELAAVFAAPDYHYDIMAAQAAVSARSMFNVIETASGDKIDFWLLTEDPFDRERFARRRREEVFGFPVYVSSPEDTIMMKLRWAKLSGGSQKQFQDALRVYEVQGASLDESYIGKWAAVLEVGDMWRQIKEQAEPV